MHNRRKFLRNTTLAAGSLAFLQPLKTLAMPGSMLKSPGKISILNLNNTGQVLDKVPDGSFLSQLSNFSVRLKNESVHTLVLGTGNIMGEPNASKRDHIEKLTWLKKTGYDAIFPNFKDLEKDPSFYKDLAKECNVASLTGVAGEHADNNTLPYHIVIKGNIKIGIIGNEINNNSTAEHHVEEVASKLNKTADILKTDHRCTLIVSVNPCHSNLKVCNKEKEKLIAGLTQNIDVIVGSNSKGKQATTYVLKNALRHEVILTYQAKDDAFLKGLDISLNSKMEKINLSLTRIA